MKSTNNHAEQLKALLTKKRQAPRPARKTRAPKREMAERVLRWRLS